MMSRIITVLIFVGLLALACNLPNNLTSNTETPIALPSPLMSTTSALPTLNPTVTRAASGLPPTAAMATPTPVGILSMPFVSYGLDGVYLVSVNSAPKKILSGRWLNNPKLSPNGQRIIYSYFPGRPNVEQLWLASSDGSNAHLLLDGTSRVIGWVNNDMVLYTTYKLPDAPTEFSFAGDLWALNVNTGATNQLMPKTTDRFFYISPDKQWVAYTTREEAGLISIDGKILRDKVLTFEAYGIGGPEAKWNADSKSFFLHAIKPPDKTVLYEITTEGKFTEKLTLAGEWYLQIAPNAKYSVLDEGGKVFVINAANERKKFSDVGLRGLVAWSLNSQIFFYTVESGNYLYNVETNASQKLSLNEEVDEAQWLDANTLLIRTGFNPPLDHNKPLAFHTYTLSTNTIKSLGTIAKSPVSTCPSKSFTPSRMVVGDKAYVSLQPPNPNNIRSEPNPTAKLLGTIAPGEVVTIVEGPGCSNNWHWWKVKSTTQNLEGWTAEGDEKDYWLIPCISGGKCGSN
jgi:hypothetical protein